MLIEQIQKAKLEAFKKKDDVARGILSMVADRYNIQNIEARAAGKTLGDVEVIAVIMKVLKELEEEKAGYLQAGNTKRAADIDHQSAAIKAFLPKLMSEKEIRAEIAKLADKTLPNVMKHFKVNFAGKVDMSLVSQIAKTL